MTNRRTSSLPGPSKLMASPQLDWCRADQPLEALGPAVGVVRGEQVNPVVAPPARAGELRHGQQLDGVHTQVNEVIQTADHTIEGAFGRTRADVALVQDRAGQRQAPPAVVGPGER